jgi:hypothetical protein
MAAISSGHKVGATTVRASAALAAAGAYDTASAATAIDVQQSSSLELFISYTRGGASGSCKFKVLVSDDAVNFFERTVEDGASLSSGTMNVYTAQHQLPAAAGASAELRSYIITVGTAGWVKVLFAEVGNTGAPGTVAATCVLGK